MEKNGNRALPGAVHSIGIDSAAEPIPQAKVTQAISSRALPAGWLQGVCSDVRIGILHRLALVGLGLHRYRNDSGLDAVASEIGVDRVTISRAIDIGVRRGWLADFPGRVPRFAFTFPTARNLQDRPPSTTLRRAP